MLFGTWKFIENTDSNTGKKEKMANYRNKDASEKTVPVAHCKKYTYVKLLNFFKETGISRTFYVPAKTKIHIAATVFFLKSKNI